MELILFLDIAQLVDETDRADFPRTTRGEVWRRGLVHESGVVIKGSEGRTLDLDLESLSPLVLAELEPIEVVDETVQRMLGAVLTSLGQMRRKDGQARRPSSCRKSSRNCEGWICVGLLVGVKVVGEDDYGSRKTRDPPLAEMFDLLLIGLRGERLGL